MNQDTLQAFGTGIQQLINRENLTRNETARMFREVLLSRQPDLHQGAFLAALAAKGETAGELAGAWEAIDDLDTLHIKTALPTPVVENSGTGMDAVKTFNVSSAAAIVAAACGVTMARHGARALTSRFGTVDILESVGLDVECDVEIVGRSLQTEQIGLFNGMSPKVHPAALGRILSQIRFGSTLNIAASLAHPARPRYAVRGVYNERLVELTAQVMIEIGYTRGLVVYGRDDASGLGIDELSITGATVLLDFNAGRKIRRSILRPEDVGLKTAARSEIAPTENLGAERRRFVEVLAGCGAAACIDFVCLNAAAVLYVAGQTTDFREGIRMSRQAIEDGRALRKLRNWVRAQNAVPAQGLTRLNEVLAEAGL